MKILFATPHRDLSRAYEKILTGEGEEVVTAFEGTQALRLAVTEKPELVFLDREIPRVPADRVLAELHGMGIPTVILTPERVLTRHLLAEELPEAFLAYPFEPSELLDLTRRLEIAGREGAFFAGSAEVRDFTLGARRVTLGEIELLKRVLAGTNARGEEWAPYADALNEKLKAASAGGRIVPSETGMKWRQEYE